MTTPPLALHPDRLFPADPGVRRLASSLYDRVRELPIISRHGHVPAQWMADDVSFAVPTSLLITPDPYVTRLLHGHGVDLADLGVGQDSFDEAASRRAFRILCEHWGAYRGTPVRFWLDAQLGDIFGIEVRPSAATADAVYDQIAERLGHPDYRARALFDRFGIEVLATTDDPCDDLAAHRRLADDPSWDARVVPTFRPDRYLEPLSPTWNTDVDRLAETSGIETGGRTSSPTAPCRPTTATWTPGPTRSPTPRPGTSTRWPARATSGPTRPSPCGGTCCSRWV